MPGPAVDACFDGIYTPGNIGASSGQTPVQPGIPSLLDPNDYDPAAVTYSHDASRFYNAFIFHHRSR
jgi:hypothetical protein